MSSKQEEDHFKVDEYQTFFGQNSSDMSRNFLFSPTENLDDETTAAEDESERVCDLEDDVEEDSDCDQQNSASAKNSGTDGREKSYLKSDETFRCECSMKSNEEFGQHFRENQSNDRRPCTVKRSPINIRNLRRFSSNIPDEGRKPETWKPIFRQSRPGYRLFNCCRGSSRQSSLQDESNNRDMNWNTNFMRSVSNNRNNSRFSNCPFRRNNHNMRGVGGYVPFTRTQMSHQNFSNHNAWLTSETPSETIRPVKLKLNPQVATFSKACGDATSHLKQAPSFFQPENSSYTPRQELNPNSCYLTGSANNPNFKVVSQQNQCRQVFLPQTDPDTPAIPGRTIQNQYFSMPPTHNNKRKVPPYFSQSDDSQRFESNPQVSGINRASRFGINGCHNSSPPNIQYCHSGMPSNIHSQCTKSVFSDIPSMRVCGMKENSPQTTHIGSSPINQPGICNEQPLNANAFRPIDSVNPGLHGYQCQKPMACPAQVKDCNKFLPNLQMPQSWVLFSPVQYFLPCKYIYKTGNGSLVPAFFPSYPERNSATSGASIQASMECNSATGNSVQPTSSAFRPLDRSQSETLPKSKEDSVPEARTNQTHFCPGQQLTSIGNAVRRIVDRFCADIKNLNDDSPRTVGLATVSSDANTAVGVNMKNSVSSNVVERGQKMLKRQSDKFSQQKKYEKKRMKSIVKKIEAARETEAERNKEAGRKREEELERAGRSEEVEMNEEAGIGEDAMMIEEAENVEHILTNLNSAGLNSREGLKSEEDFGSDKALKSDARAVRDEENGNSDGMLQYTDYIA